MSGQIRSRPKPYIGRKSMTPQDLTPEIGPELRRKVHESIVGDVDNEMHQDGGASAARGRVIQIGEAGTHGAAQKVVEIETVAA